MAWPYRGLRILSGNVSFVWTDPTRLERTIDSGKKTSIGRDYSGKSHSIRDYSLELL